MKILLVDGNSILNRGFYALPPLSDKNGIFTNAILGFCNILLKEIECEKPDFLTVAFDVHAPTFRHKMYAEYKGTRKPMPPELKMQLPIIREVLSSMKVNVVEMAGYEADDLLGTLAKKSEALGMDVTLLSGDRDLLQIASSKIKIALPKTSGGKSETHYYYESDVLNEYGVTPTEYIEVKALQGDSSDNIPGVPGVGPKTATELIATYHTLEALYENVDDLVKKKALYEKLTSNKDNAFFSRTLSRIEINAPIEPDFEASKNKELLNEESMDVLLKYSLKSVINKLESLGGEEAATVKSEKKQDFSFEVIEDFNETENLMNKLSKSAEVGIYVCDSGVSFSFNGQTYFVRYFGFINDSYFSDKLPKLLQGKKVYTLSVKPLYDLTKDYFEGINDAEILAYLLDPNKGDYPLTYLCERYLSRFFGDLKELLSDKEKYSSLVAFNSIDLCKTLFEEVKKLSMDKLYFEIEMPLSFVLYSMEKEGVLVDVNALKEYSKKLLVRIEELEKGIYEKAGCSFNINSPKQLGEILFEKMGIEGGKKTKTGYSTAADVLEGLKGDYPIVSDILEYRMLTKLNSTYAEGLQTCVASDGRIHTHFNQTITGTGRISSTDPNLQNIPIRTELGRELRKVFYPKKGYCFVDADYSQIELRLMASMSGDKKMIEAFKSGKDIHRSTASEVFNIPFDEVTNEERRSAKAVNFGIIYGISAFGLSQDIGIDRKAAKKYIDDYLATYPSIDNYQKNTVLEAKETGVTKTLFGRIRPIPELKDANFMRRQAGERIAMNAPLQGTAADIMKIAMINIFKRLRDENLQSKMIIQVHDEVLIETLESEKETVISLVKEEMMKAANLSVALEAEANAGATWFDAH